MIDVRNVSKQYGRVRAVNDVFFSCPEKQIVGLLGVNGAGKTTLLNMITGCMPPDAGEILIDGMDIRKNARDCRRRLGYLPERPPLYDEMTVTDYLAFVCRLREVERKDIARHVNNLLELCGLDEVRGKLLGHLSKGYRQRAGIAQALCGDPQVLVLDEPTVGLDPRQVVDMRELIRLLGKDHTILFSSHVLSEVQSLCQRVVIVHHGRVIREERLGENALARTEHEIRISVRASEPQTRAALRELPGYTGFRLLPQTDTGFTEGLVTVQEGSDGEEGLFRLFAGRGLPLRLLCPSQDSLEELFLRVTGEEGKTA